MIEHIEYCKISVHNHFGGNTADRVISDVITKVITFDMNDAITKIEDAYESKFNLLAFTNSNTILPFEFLKLKKMCHILSIELVPGVEVNISNNDNDKFLHCTLLFSPEVDLINLSKELDSLYISNGKFYLSVDNLADLVLKRRTIIIPHGVKQSGTGRSASTNPEQFKELIAFDKAFPVIIEDNKKFNKVTLKENINDLLSDSELQWLDESSNVSCADRQLCSEIESPTYIWGDNTFNDLYFAAIMKGSRIKRGTDIINKTNYITKIVITPKVANPQILPIVIECSHGLNSIIGKSGSGKTLLLNAINRQILGTDLKHKNSGKSEYGPIYKDVNIELLDSEGNPIDITDKWEVFEGENLYNQILQIYSDDKTEIIKKFSLDINSQKFNTVINNHMIKINDYVSKSISIIRNEDNISSFLAKLHSNIKFLEENDIKGQNSITYVYDDSVNSKKADIVSELEELKKDKEQIVKNIEILKRYAKKYELADSLEDHFAAIIELLQKKIMVRELSKQTLNLKYGLDLMKKQKIYEIVETYNKTIGSKILSVNTKKQENLNIISSIVSELKKIAIAKTSHNIPILSKKDFDGCLLLKDNDLAQINMKEVILTFNWDILDDVFPNDIGRKSGAINLSEFKSLEKLDLTDADSVNKFLNVFVGNEYSTPIQINMDYNRYLKFEILLKSDDGEYENIDNMSAGELSKAYITNMIDIQIKKTGSNMIVLFDQPEANLEKKFILDDLVQKFDYMRNNYQVFITTHEPLLVVNADSNNIIRAENEKKLGKSNEIKYSTLSFVDSPDTKEKMVEKIAELVDGSHDAVKQRNKIYGGMIYEN